MGSRKPINDAQSVDLEFVGSNEEMAETRTLASRARLRDQMQTDIEAFLTQGGEISEIAPNVMADPPQKPSSNYGSRPI
jgi:hypothetical protein